MPATLQIPAFRAGELLYETRANDCQLAAGTLFTVRAVAPISTGDLVLALVNGILIVGRWFPSVAGGNWLLQTARIICCAGANVAILGVVLAWQTTC